MSFYFDDDNDDRAFSQPFRSLLQQPSQQQSVSPFQSQSQSQFQSQSQSQSSAGTKPRSQVTFSQTGDTVLSFHSPLPPKSLSQSQPLLVAPNNNNNNKGQTPVPTFVCHNCGAADDYYKDEAAGGVLTCFQCFTQSQAFEHAPEEEFDYDESQNMAVRNRDGSLKTLGRKKNSSNNSKNNNNNNRNADGTLKRGRPPTPLEDCDFTVPPPPLEDCLEGLGSVLRKSCKLLCLELMDVELELEVVPAHSGNRSSNRRTRCSTRCSRRRRRNRSDGNDGDDSSESSSDASSTDSSELPLPPQASSGSGSESETEQRRALFRAVSSTARDLWKAYLWSWKEGADFYGALYPQVRFCLRDAFLGVGRQRILYHTLAARARAGLLRTVRAEARMARATAKATATAEAKEKAASPVISDGDDSDDSDRDDSDEDVRARNGSQTRNQFENDSSDDDDDSDDYFAAVRNRKKRIKLEQQEQQHDQQHDQQQESEIDKLLNLFGEETETIQHNHKRKTKSAKDSKTNLPVPDIVLSTTSSRGFKRSDSNTTGYSSYSNNNNTDLEEDDDGPDSDNDNDEIGNENKNEDNRDNDDDGTCAATCSVASDLSVLDGHNNNHLPAHYLSRSVPRSSAAPSSSILRKRKRTVRKESKDAYTNNTIAKLLLYHNKLVAKKIQRSKNNSNSNSNTNSKNYKHNKYQQYQPRGDPVLGRKEAALLLRPSMGLVAGILLVAGAPHGVTEKQVVDWIENGSLPLLRANEHLLFSEQQQHNSKSKSKSKSRSKSLAMIASSFFSMPVAPTASQLRHLAKRIHVACGYKPPTVRLVAPTIPVAAEFPTTTTPGVGARRGSRSSVSVLVSPSSPPPPSQQQQQQQQQPQPVRRKPKPDKILTAKSLYKPGRLVRPSTVPLLIGKLVSELGFSQIVLNYSLALAGLSVSREALRGVGGNNGDCNGENEDIPSWMVEDCDVVVEPPKEASTPEPKNTEPAKREEPSTATATTTTTTTTTDPLAPSHPNPKRNRKRKTKDDDSVYAFPWKDETETPPVFDLTKPEEVIRFKRYKNMHYQRKFRAKQREQQQQQHAKQCQDKNNGENDNDNDKNENSDDDDNDDGDASVNTETLVQNTDPTNDEKEASVCSEDDGDGDDGDNSSVDTKNLVRDMNKDIDDGDGETNEDEEGGIEDEATKDSENISAKSESSRSADEPRDERGADEKGEVLPPTMSERPPVVVHKRRRTWLPSPILGARPDKLSDLDRILAVVVVACKLIPGWDQNHRYRFARGGGTEESSGSASGSHGIRATDRFVPWNQSHFRFIGNGRTERDYLQFLEEFVFPGSNHHALPKFVESLKDSTAAAAAAAATNDDGVYNDFHHHNHGDEDSSSSGNSNSDSDSHTAAAVIPNDAVLGWTSPPQEAGSSGVKTNHHRPPRLDKVPYRPTTNADTKGLRTLDSPLGSLIEYIAYKTETRPDLILKHLIELDKELSAKYTRRSRNPTGLVAIPPAKIYNELMGAVDNATNKKKGTARERTKKQKTRTKKQKRCKTPVRSPNNVLLGYSEDPMLSPFQFNDVLTQREPEMEELLSVGETDWV